MTVMNCICIAFGMGKDMFVEPQLLAHISFPTYQKIHSVLHYRKTKSYRDKAFGLCDSSFSRSASQVQCNYTQILKLEIKPQVGSFQAPFSR